MILSLDHGPALPLRLSHRKLTTVPPVGQLISLFPVLLIKTCRPRGAVDNDQGRLVVTGISMLPKVFSS